MTASSLGPISNNHLFPSSTVDATFAKWERRGLKCFYDLYDGDHFTSFDSLHKKYNLAPSDLFRYFQICHFALKQFPSYPNLPCKSLWEKLLETQPAQKGMISHIYYQVMNAADNFSSIKTKWENELGMNLTEDWWAGALKRVNTSTSCARLSFIQFKVVHRMLFSKSRLAKNISRP